MTSFPGLDTRLAAAILFVVCASAARAQSNDPDTAFYRLPAVIVNVTRSPLRVLDAPMAITVVPVRAFENTNGLRADQALRNVPGVLAQSRYGGSDVRIVVRGFGARGAGDRSNAGTTRGVRIMQDGFPETEPDGRTALDLVDLAAVERVEVVRSNASALWGNAGGGLINFSTIPTQATPGLMFGVQTGAFGLLRAIGSFNQYIGGGQLYGTLVRTDFDGWRDRSGSQRSVGNVGMVAELSARTQLRVHALAADNSFDIPGPLTLAQYQAEPQQANPTYAQRLERRRNRTGRLGIGVDHALSAEQSLSGTLYVNPKYLQRSERGTYRDFTRYHVGGSALYRVAHPLTTGVRGSFAVGADEAYQDGAILFYSLTPEGGRGTTLRDNKREGANNLGVFAQELLAFGQRLDVTVGARYDVVSYNYHNYIDPSLDDDRSFERLTPKLGVLYRLSRDHTVYANIGGGVEVPAGNETDPVGTFGTDTVTALNPLLEPIHSTTIEVGTKQIHALGSGFLRAVSYDVALYRTNVINEIIPYQGGRFYFTAGRAERRGAELGLATSTSAGIDLRASFTFSDNRYRDYQVDSVHYGRPGHIADFAGNRIVGIPDRFFTVNAQYSPALLRWLEMEVEVQHVGAYFADDANTVNVPGYSLIHAGAGLRAPLRVGGGFALSGYVRAENIADKQFIGSAFLNPDVVDGVPVAFEPGTPRHVVLNMSISRSSP